MATFETDASLVKDSAIWVSGGFNGMFNNLRYFIFPWITTAIDHIHNTASNTVIFNSHQPEHDSGKQAREKAKTHVKLTRNFNCKFYLTFYLYFHSFLGFQEFFLGLKQSLVNAQEKETSGKKRKSCRDKKRWHCAILLP